MSELSTSQNEKVAVYLRVSTDRQVLDSQETAIENWLAAKSVSELNVTYFRDHGISGAKGESQRPGLRSLMTAIKSGEYTKLVTFELSRLSRDYMDFLKIMETCDQNGVVVEVPGEGAISFNSNQAKLIASIRAFLASEEREKISTRVKAGLASARQRGVKLGRPKGHHSNRGYRKPYDPAMIESIRRLTNKGLSSGDICSLLSGQYKLSPSTVKRIRRRFNMRRP